MGPHTGFFANCFQKCCTHLPTGPHWQLVVHMPGGRYPKSLAESWPPTLTSQARACDHLSRMLPINLDRFDLPCRTEIKLHVDRRCWIRCRRPIGLSIRIGNVLDRVLSTCGCGGKICSLGDVGAGCTFARHRQAIIAETRHLQLPVRGYSKNRAAVARLRGSAARFRGNSSATKAARTRLHHDAQTSMAL